MCIRYPYNISSTYLYAFTRVSIHNLAGSCGARPFCLLTTHYTVYTYLINGLDYSLNKLSPLLVVPRPVHMKDDQYISM